MTTPYTKNEIISIYNNIYLAIPSNDCNPLNLDWNNEKREHIIDIIPIKKNNKTNPFYNSKPSYYNQQPSCFRDC